MIRINLLSKLDKDVAAARAAIRARSFSGRNPALGKMFNCEICGNRHRSIKICKPIYATGRYDLAPEGEKKILIASQKTLKGVIGARAVAKKRFHPHPSKRKLRLVQRTQEIYPTNAPYFKYAVECMKYSRTLAGRQLRFETGRTKKLARDQQKLSRRINQLSAVPGARLPNRQLTVTAIGLQSRREKLAKRTEANKVKNES